MRRARKRWTVSCAAACLVDLFRIVRQGVRVSQESYSLKKVEKLYMPKREGPVTRPGFALVEYEKWMESHDPAILEGLTAYNRDDCVSIWKMRAWLEGLREEAEAQFGIKLGRPQAEAGNPGEELAAQIQETQALVEALTQDIPADPADRRASSRRAGCWRSSSTGTGARASPSGGSTTD
jgi:uncharacterized protein